MDGYGDTYEINLILDTQLDLGKREHYNGTAGMFSSTYGKCYTFVIGNADTGDANYAVDEGEMIVLHGWYVFKPSRYIAPEM